jgi:hypothetical protein
MILIRILLFLLKHRKKSAVNFFYMNQRRQMWRIKKKAKQRNVSLDTSFLLTELITIGERQVDTIFRFF